jgi:DNA-nicking Smr family endonuclease
VHQIDLHGLSPEGALRRLEQELHASRVRGRERVLVITGRGLGNKKGKPVLRGYVETWLAGPAGRRLGVRGFRRESRGGALEVEL